MSCVSSSRVTSVITPSRSCFRHITTPCSLVLFPHDITHCVGVQKAVRLMLVMLLGCSVLGGCEVAIGVGFHLYAHFVTFTPEDDDTGGNRIRGRKEERKI